MYRIQKECCFAEIFSKKSGAARPVACSRSDYDGKQWWTTWSRPEEGKESNRGNNVFGKEMDEFREALMSKPEMETLESMKEYCLKNRLKGRYNPRYARPLPRSTSQFMA